MRRFLRTLAVVAAACLAACAVALAILLWPTSTPPFVGADGRPTAGSIARMETLELGGVAQSVWFRGRSVDAPALILLHGGPGASESALFRHYVPGLEDHFLVVYWDQRGAGRSYHAGMSRDSMTIARMARDLDALVDTVRRRFHKDRVALLGHSWGTILGTRYAAAHPEKVSVYVGVAQIADFAADERTALAWALEQARSRGDAKAVRRLEAMAPRPNSVDEELALGEIVARFGGEYAPGLSTGKLILAALGADEANLVDLVKFGRGNRFSLEALRPEYAREDLTRFRSFDVPIVLMLGRHDWHIPAVLAARWLRTVDAPSKRLLWFERSAHDPPFAQPDDFVRAMVDVVLPLARARASM